MALTAAVDAMGRAATHLQRRQTGRITQEAEQSGIDRLKLLLAGTMEPEKPGQSSGGSGQGNQGPKKNEGGPSGGVLPLAQLKLLKLLQEDLNLRTQQLHQAEAAGKPAAELRDDYSRLSDEQNRLAESMFQLLHPQPENGDPEGGENEGKEEMSMDKRMQNSTREHGARCTGFSRNPPAEAGTASVAHSVLLLILIGSLAGAAEPPRSTDDQLRDSLDSKTGDDYDRELLGDAAKPDDKGRADEQTRKRLEKELAPPAQKEEKPKDPLLQIAEEMREVPQRLDRRRSGRGDAASAAADCR